MGVTAAATMALLALLGYATHGMLLVVVSHWLWGHVCRGVFCKYGCCCISCSVEGTMRCFIYAGVAVSSLLLPVLHVKCELGLCLTGGTSNAQVGCAEIVGRIVEDLKDESEPYRRMVMETVDKARQALHIGPFSDYA